MVSVFPLTAAEENAGGVLLVTVQSPALVVASRLPDRSLNWRAAAGGALYHTFTLWPCRAWPVMAGNVRVTVRPLTVAPVAFVALSPAICWKNGLAAPPIVTLSSSASSKTSVTVRPFTAALLNTGPVSSVSLAAWRPVKVSTSLPLGSCSGLLAGLA